MGPDGDMVTVGVEAIESLIILTLIWSDSYIIVPFRNLHNKKTANVFMLALKKAM